jgi:diacylglycerol kinase (ATP)
MQGCPRACPGSSRCFPIGPLMNPEHSPYKSKGGFRRLWNALRYSRQGLSSAFVHEAAFRQELMVAVILTPAAFWLAKDYAQTILLIGTLFFVLIVELINSALEALADAITLQQHPLIGRAKDLGSAAVMLAIILAALAWLAVIAVNIPDA